MERLCKICNKTKSLDKFVRNRAAPLGHKYYCYECNREQERKRYREKFPKAPPKTTRKCYVCKKVKLLIDFAENKSKPLGKDYICRPCSRSKAQEYTSSPQGRVTQKQYRESPRGLAIRKKWKQSTKGQISQQQAKKRYNEKYPEKRSCRAIFNSAIRHGKIKRGTTCILADENCKGQIQGHHRDYSKPFDVVWLCDYHHRQERWGQLTDNQIQLLSKTLPTSLDQP